MGKPLYGRPLSELDQVDWKGLHHCRGYAENIPELLQSFANGEPHAKDELWDCLWHQGSIYPATLAAIPYIIGMIEIGILDACLFQMLALTADGQGYFGDADDIPSHFVPNSSRFVLSPDEEILYIPQAYSAVQLGLPIYREFLNHPSVNLRRTNVYLLSRYLNNNHEVLSTLMDLAEEETEESILAAIGWALGFSSNQRLATYTLKSLIKHNSIYIRFNCANSLLRLHPTSEDDEWIQSLCDGIASPSVPEWYSHLLGGGIQHEPFDWALATIKPRSLTSRERFAVAAITCFKNHYRPFHADVYLHHALDLLDIEKEGAMSDLARESLNALLPLIDSPKGHMGVSVKWCLERRGLPSQYKDLVHFLDKERV